MALAQQASATSTAPTLKPPLKSSYAALGASETYGVGASSVKRSYAYLVANMLHARHFVDTGVPGITIDQAYDSELTRALAIRPSLCTAFFGFNDIRTGVTRDAFLRDLHDLSTTLRQAKCKVVIVGMPDLSLMPAARATGLGGLKQISAYWNKGMRTVAQQTGASFFDLQKFDATIKAHPGYIGPDGVHPTDKGYAVLAKYLAAFIRAHHLWSNL